METFGALALLPVAAILLVAVFTRRTLFAMVTGTVVGAIILGGWAFFDSWIEYFGKSMSNETLHWLVMVVVLFGILIVLLEKSNAVRDFAAWTEHFVNSRRKSLVLSFVLTIVLFIDDYLSSLAVGTSMKGVTDRYGVPRTQLGAIVKMTAAPACVLIPFSTWALFFSGLLENEGVTVNGTGFGAYIQSIPFIFFGWLAIAIAFLLAMGWIPMMGSLKRDNNRANETGNLLPEGLSADEIAAELTETQLPDGYKPRPWNFLIPIVTMITVTIVMDIDVLKGTVAALVVAIILYVAQRKVTLKEVADGALTGIVSMAFVIILSVLAFMVQAMNVDLKLADFVIEGTTPFMSGAWLPAIVFLVCGIYAYATGSFWDLAAVITPIVIPLALSMEVDPILAAAAVFSGAALGSTTCLYGDGIILASRSTGVRPINLMLAILPYAGIAAGLSFALYIVAGFVSHGG